MKGLRKYIAPFAPDQSGAAAVFCELGGMVIILDAGGCAGNICGFDEPRWFGTRSAIFSAGLRDMDAILGRDDRLVGKVAKACRRLDCRFVAVIGTPVPSVIATDYRAIKRMIEKKTGLPVVTVDTNGMELYDAGVRKAYLALFKTFAKKGEEELPGTVGILGATPLDVTTAPGTYDKRDYACFLKDHYKSKGYQSALPYGMGSGLSDVKSAGGAVCNIVISPAALPAARWLEKTFGIPYRTDYPLETIPGWDRIREELAGMQGKKILIVHQQMLANAIRNYIREAALEKYIDNVDVTVSSWFDMDPSLMEKQDVRIREEDDWTRLVKEGHFDAVIGDALFAAALPDYKGQWVNVEHFAVSGKR